MRRRRREHSLLLKASKILVSWAQASSSHSVTGGERYAHFRSGGEGAAVSAAPAARNADATSPRREIGVSISPQVEPGVSADEKSLRTIGPFPVRLRSS